MRILITGGSGFLGHGLTRRLLKDDHDVRIYSRGEFSQFKMNQKLKGDSRLGFFVGDVRDLHRLERAMLGCDVVIHAAALKRIETGNYNPDEMVKTNVLGSMNVIEASRLAKVKRVIFVSSDKAYQPVSPYGLSKALGETLFLAANNMSFGPRHVVCRYGNVAGSTGSVIPIWREHLSNGNRLPLTLPDCTRFWMRLEQAVDLVLSAITSKEELLIPTLPAFELIDLAIALGGDKVQITNIGLPAFEKKHESMSEGNSSDTARRMSIDEIRTELSLI